MHSFNQSISQLINSIHSLNQSIIRSSSHSSMPGSPILPTHQGVAVLLLNLHPDLAVKTPPALHRDDGASELQSFVLTCHQSPVRWGKQGRFLGFQRDFSRKTNKPTNSKTTWKMDLGGGLKYFWFSPRSLGKWSNLTSIFFKWVGSTTN